MERLLWKKLIVFLYFIDALTQGPVGPLNVAISIDMIPVAGRSEVTLLTCTASRSHPASEVFWKLSPLLESVKSLTEKVKHQDGTFTVVSKLMASPTPQMNQQEAKCVVRHPMLTEDKEISHRLTVYYAPQLVTVKPLHSSDGEIYQCEADANPKVSYFHWYRHGQNLSKDAIKIDGDKLHFLNMSPDLTGLYVCEVSNEYGEGRGSLYWHQGNLQESNFFTEEKADDLHTEL